MNLIRPALSTDAISVAPLIFQAMPEIVFHLIGEKNYDKSIAFIKELFQKEDNQYSYQNTLVYEKDGMCVGSLVFYNGGDLHRLRMPVLELAQKQNSKKISIEDETQKGEIYIDTLSVNHNFQGLGIGSSLIQFLQKTISKSQKLGLLVDSKNPKAEQLYFRLGFRFSNFTTLSGSIYKHLVWEK